MINKTDSKKINRKDGELIPMRACTTCKKPTRNYRCEECWAKLREK